MYWLVLAGLLVFLSFLVPLLVAAFCRQFAENACRRGNQDRAQVLVSRCLLMLELPPWGWTRFFAKCRSNHCDWIGRECAAQGWDQIAEDLLRRGVFEGRRAFAHQPRELSSNLFHLADFFADRGRTSEALTLCDEIHDLHGDVIPFDDAWYHLARSYRDTLRGRRERSSIRRIFDRRRQAEHPASRGSGPTS